MTRHYGAEATMPCFQEASKHQVTSNRTPTDTGGQVENTKALEENSGEGTRQNGAVNFGRRHADM